MGFESMSATGRGYHPCTGPAHFLSPLPHEFFIGTFWILMDKLLKLPVIHLPQIGEVVLSTGMGFWTACTIMEIPSSHAIFCNEVIPYI